MMVSGIECETGRYIIYDRLKRVRVRVDGLGVRVRVRVRVRFRLGWVCMISVYHI